jgi:TorA maturation chaperone TorD
VSDLASSRAKAYSFLASVYLQVPRKELITEFLNHPPFSIDSQGMKTLNEFLSHNKLTPPELLHERLGREHLRLFGGLAHRHSPPPPYESVWTGEGKVMGKATVNVLKIYGEARVELTTRTTEPPDHIGIELAYLSYLCTKEADARRSTDANATAKYLHMQYDFLRHHVERWVPNFCQHIAKDDRTGFYRGIATVTKEFVLADSEAIQEELRKNGSEQFSEKIVTEAFKSPQTNEKEQQLENFDNLHKAVRLVRSRQLTARNVGRDAEDV